MDQETTHVKGKYVSKKGAEFAIQYDSDGNGLYTVHMMNGGKRPAICEERFTSYKFAEAALIDYLENHSTISLDIAEYPGKKRGKSQTE